MIVIERWCDCDLFTRWYEDVCRCGHLAETHVDDTRLCMGSVRVHRGAIGSGQTLPEPRS